MLLKDFMQGLLDEAGLNPNSLANRMKMRSIQSVVERITEEKTKNPRRSTIEPVADFFKVPVAAFFDLDIAARIAQQRGWPGHVRSISEPDAAYRVSAAPDSRSAKSAQATIHDLALDMARALTPFDLSARKAAASLLADLALHPELGASTAAHLARLLGDPGNDRPAASTHSGGHSGK